MFSGRIIKITLFLYLWSILILSLMANCSRQLSVANRCWEFLKDQLIFVPSCSSSLEKKIVNSLQSSCCHTVLSKRKSILYFTCLNIQVSLTYDMVLAPWFHVSSDKKIVTPPFSSLVTEFPLKSRVFLMFWAQCSHPLFKFVFHQLYKSYKLSFNHVKYWAGWSTSWNRLPGEISITSDMQMTPPLWQKVKKN